MRYALFRTRPHRYIIKTEVSWIFPNPASFFGDGYNPVGLAYNTNTKYYNYSLLGDIYVQLTPVKNLVIKSDLGRELYYHRLQTI